jgi:S1-C subfamily serine protease
MGHGRPGTCMAVIALLCVAACTLSCAPAGGRVAETRPVATGMPTEQVAATRRGITPTPEPAPDAEPTPTMTFRRALIQVQEATVAVGMVLVGKGGEETRCETFGSGTIVDPQGLIVTSAHVLKEGDLYCIACTRGPDSQPNWCYDARAIKRDAVHDLALLFIESRPRGAALDYLSLPAVPMGDSNQVRTGDTIYMVGYPSVGGATVTVTRGMVAGFEENRTLIKTDAEFSAGSSGGPAISENGELIGIAVKVRVEDTGKLGYLVSANEVRRFIR